MKLSNEGNSGKSVVGDSFEQALSEFYLFFNNEDLMALNI